MERMYVMRVSTDDPIMTGQMLDALTWTMTVGMADSDMQIELYPVGHPAVPLDFSHAERVGDDEYWVEVSQQLNPRRVRTTLHRKPRT